MKAGVQAYQAGEFKDAEKRFQQALKLAEAIGPESPQFGSTLAYLGMTSKALGDLNKAESHLKRAVVLMERDPGSDHRDLAFLTNELGLIYYQRIPGTRAYVSGQTTYTVRVTTPVTSGQSPEMIAQRAASAAQAGFDQFRRQLITENYPLAEQCFERVLVIEEKNSGPSSMQLVPTLDLLGDLYMAAGHFPEADTTFVRALNIVESQPSPDNAKIAAFVFNLGLSATRQKKYAEADTLFSRAVGLQLKALGPEHQDVATTLEAHAAVLKELGRKDEAKQLEQRANAIRKLNPKK